MTHTGAVGVLFLAVMVGGTAYGRSQKQVRPDVGTWVTYTHPSVPFSFRHPAGWTVEARDVSSFNIEGLVAAVDLENEQTSRTILRFMVSEPAVNGSAVRYDKRFLRKVCKSYEAMKIGQRDAVNCVTCGRGACQWTVHVLGPRQFRILSFLAEEEGKAAPKDGQFPLLTIIRSLESR